LKKTSDNEPNLKLPEKTISQLKNVNERLIKHGFDNIKVLNSIAVDEFKILAKSMTVHELFAFVIKKTYDLQKKGVVKSNARSIGKDGKKRY
jgi:hypothetical protein